MDAASAKLRGKSPESTEETVDRQTVSAFEAWICADNKNCQKKPFTCG
jgi:hypothetical protein